MWKLVKCSISCAEDGVLWPRVAPPLGHSGFERECVTLGLLGQDSGFVRYLWDEAHVLTSTAQC